MIRSRYNIMINILLEGIALNKLLYLQNILLGNKFAVYSVQ